MNCAHQFFSLATNRSDYEKEQDYKRAFDEIVVPVLYESLDWSPADALRKLEGKPADGVYELADAICKWHQPIPSV